MSSPTTSWSATSAKIWLLDWGSAQRLAPGAKPRLYGTPIYMSPEQARAEGVDARSDIYCLGATMFHALLRRCPTWSADSDVFWRKKRAGEIDAPSAQERARVPAVLLDIALKAMAADPAARYASAEALVEPAGLPTRPGGERAHREGHARVRWSPVAFPRAALVRHGGSGGGHRRARGHVVRRARQGDRALGASDPGRRLRGQLLGPQWHPVDGDFRVEDGRLVSQQGSNHILLNQRPGGPTAIEYDAEIAPGSHRGDLS